MLRLLCRLPLPPLLWIGRALGILAWFMIGKRRKIVLDNIKLAFPDMPEREQQQLARAHFRELGMGFIESLYAWHAPADKLKKLAIVDGLEHLPKNQGALLMFGHFTTLEIGGTLLALTTPINAMYRKQSGRINQMMIAGRQQFVEHLIAKTDIRTLLTILKQGLHVYYAADQHSTVGAWTFTQFFNHPVATTLATSKIITKTNAALLFVTTRREGTRYRVTIHPPVAGFGEDPLVDAQTMMSFIEQEARACPANYFWVHRRFKNVPLDSLPRHVSL
jgi:Kdo2-lipid IVA lauroyltransferase/acyltransferase